MRTRPTLTLVLVAACGAAVAGVWFGKRLWATAPGSPTGEQPRNTDPFAFGLDHPPVIWRDGDGFVTFAVPVANPTAEVVRFANFANFACACGCTSARLDREELQPGESTTVRMAVNLSGREGPQHFACHWGDGAGRRWTAETRLTVYRPARFEPGLLHLGKVSAGEAICRQVQYDEFTRTVEELPPVSRFSTSSLHRDRIELTANPPVVECLGVGLVRRRTSLDVTFTVPTRGGYSEAFLMPSTASFGQPTPSVRIDWSVRETVELSPARLALTFPTGSEDRRTQSVRVRLVGGGAVVIDKLTTTDPAIRARVLTAERSHADVAEIEVTVVVPGGQQVLTGEVVLQLGSLGEREVRMPVTAFRVGGQ